MKNYEELTNDLLERRNHYLQDQAEKRKRIVRAATSFCSFCLVGMIGFGIWHNRTSSAEVDDELVIDAMHSGIKNPDNSIKSESEESFSANNFIAINSIEPPSNDMNKMNIALMTKDFIKMTRDEMIIYYGVDYIPDVPADIKAWEDESCGIFRRNGGTGEVYWDADVLNFSNKDFTRNVNLTVQKEKRVFVDYFYFEGSEEKSIINNIEVLIGFSENGCYYAEFMYNNVGFLFCADGVTEDEFVAIIMSVLK